MGHIPTMFDCVFEPTLSMITNNFVDYPEIRESFYHFLNMVVQHCFEGLFVGMFLCPLRFIFIISLAILRMAPQQQKLVMQSVIWGFRHTMNLIAETALTVPSPLFLLAIVFSDLMIFVRSSRPCSRM